MSYSGSETRLTKATNIITVPTRIFFFFFDNPPALRLVSGEQKSYSFLGWTQRVAPSPGTPPPAPQHKFIFSSVVVLVFVFATFRPK